jgi:hypothetical protein
LPISRTAGDIIGAAHDAAARHLMPARPVPRRHWRSYGDHLLPTGEQALDEPFSAFPSWFLRIACERCGKERMISETHIARGDMLIRDILDRIGTTAAAAARGRRNCSPASRAPAADRYGASCLGADGPPLIKAKPSGCFAADRRQGGDGGAVQLARFPTGTIVIVGKTGSQRSDRRSMAKPLY